MILIKNGLVYTPEYIGKKDILIAGNQIERIQDEIDEYPFCEVIDAKGKIVTPGFIDGHVHIIGGGGEGSFHTQAPEIQLSSIINSGITTILGLLGTDGITRDVERLLAKCKALNEEGITCYITTGSYIFPPATVTGSVAKDITFIQECIGCKLALSDHRSSNVTKNELTRLASDTRLAGMISGKAGYLCLHMGDDPAGLEMVMDIVRNTSIPIKIFQPTHVGRNPKLFDDAIQFAKMGGFIDLTAGNENRSIIDKIEYLKQMNAPLDKVTISSDGQGSWSNYDEHGNLIEIGVMGVDRIHSDFTYLSEKYGVEESLKYFTKNVAKRLEIKSKGEIEEKNDADIIIMNSDLSIDSVIANGKIMVKNGSAIVKGTYEI